MEEKQEVKKELKIKDTRVFGNVDMNDLPNEEFNGESIREQVEARPLSTKLREEKERKVNKKQLRLDKKEGREPTKKPITFRCPACKYTAAENKFLHNKKMAYTACTNCGNLFIPMSHIRYSMKVVKLRENKGIIIPGG